MTYIIFFFCISKSLFSYQFIYNYIDVFYYVTTEILLFLLYLDMYYYTFSKILFCFTLLKVLSLDIVLYIYYIYWNFLYKIYYVKRVMCKNVFEYPRIQLVPLFSSSESEKLHVQIMKKRKGARTKREE